MQTDENKYYSSITDALDLNENGSISDDLGYRTLKFSIEENSQIQLSSFAYSKAGEVKKDESVILNKGEVVKYRTTLDNNYTPIKNINLITRLPFEGNKNIIGENKIDLNSTFTITDLKNVKVYIKAKNAREIELPKDSYTIGYSTNELATLDSEFTQNETDIQTAKTMQIKLQDEYILKTGYQLIVEYEGLIPEDTQAGKAVTEISAVGYIDESNNSQTQESAGSKVVVGSPAGTIELVKTFEDKNNSETLEGIGFKITNMNDKTISFEGQTDSNGHVIFNNVPVGEWEITETTVYDLYISAPRYVKITNGEKYTGEKSINIINKIKKSKLEIIKEWENTNDKLDEVTFNITGTTIGGDNFSSNIRTSIIKDNEGNKVQKAVIYVPYGDYTIKETNSLYGWYSENTEVSARKETIEVTILNKIAYGNLQINKTVPRRR